MTKLIDEMFAILIERGVYRRKTGRQNTASPGMLWIVISRFIKEITSVLLSRATFACQTSALIFSKC